MPAYDRRVLVLGIALILVPWLGAEGMIDDALWRRGIRLGLAVGLLSSPAFLLIYRGSFRGPFRRALGAVVLSLLFKATVLAAAGAAVWRWSSLPVAAVIVPLFYALFTLGFLAISLVWLRGSEDSRGT